MGYFNKFNKSTATVRDGIDTRKLEFKALKEFVGQTIKVDGFFFTTGKYGEQVVVVGNGYNINMPKRAAEEFREIARDEEAINIILAGGLSLSDIKVIDTKNGTTVSYSFEG